MFQNHSVFIFQSYRYRYWTVTKISLQKLLNDEGFPLFKYKTFYLSKDLEKPKYSIPITTGSFCC